MSIKLIPSDIPFDVPCLECGSPPMEGVEECAFMCVCSNEKCSMSFRAVQPSAWPTTKAQWDQQYQQQN